MKKILNSTVNYCGKKARITCKITDENGYISITGEIIPYRCRSVYCGGCCHEYIIKAFPRLKKYIHLHLYNLDGTQSNQIENSLYFLFNGEIDKAQNVLNCTDHEINDLAALANYGLHKTRKSYGFTYDQNALDVYRNAVNKFDLVTRRKSEIDDFYRFLADL